MTEKEKLIYDKAGGGEKGMQAVLARRKYLEEYKSFESWAGKEKRRSRYFCKNEKETATYPIEKEDYL